MPPERSAISTPRSRVSNSACATIPGIAKPLRDSVSAVSDKLPPPRFRCRLSVDHSNLIEDSTPPSCSRTRGSELPAQILANDPTGVNGKGVPLHTSRKELSHTALVLVGTLFPLHGDTS